MTHANRRAFTLAELMVVLAIVGILVAVLVVALNGSRESARRAICFSRLGDLGKGLARYEADRGTLPPGTTNPTGPVASLPEGNHISWIVHLLPDIDQQAIFDQIDLAAGAYAPRNLPARRTRIPLLICPSDESPPPTVDGQPIGASCYAGCQNDLEAPINADNRGVFFLNSRVAAADVVDGPGYTIYVAEKLPFANDLGWMSGTRATLRNTGWRLAEPERMPAAPFHLSGAAPAVAPAAGQAEGGSSAAAANADHAPLNADAAMAFDAADNPWNPLEHPLVVGGFGSSHPGVVNVLMGDGSVRALAKVIAPEVLVLMGNRDDSADARAAPPAAAAGAPSAERP